MLRDMQSFSRSLCASQRKPFPRRVLRTTSQKGPTDTALSWADTTSRPPLTAWQFVFDNGINS